MRLQNLAIYVLGQDRDGCFLVGTAALDAGLPLASGIQQIVCTEVVHSLCGPLLADQEPAAPSG